MTQIYPLTLEKTLLIFGIFVCSFLGSNFIYENSLLSVLGLLLLMIILIALVKPFDLFLCYVASIPFLQVLRFLNKEHVFEINVLKDVIFILIVIIWILKYLLKDKVNFIKIAKGHQYNTIMVIFIFYMLLQIPRTPNIMLGILGFREIVQFMFAFFLAQYYCKTEGRVKKCIQIIFISGLGVALIGILQQLTGMHYNPKIMRFLGVEIYRLSSTIGNPNTLGFFLIMNILIAVNYLYDKTKRYHCTFLLFTIVIMSICLFFTYSKTALIALFIGIIVMAAIKGKTKILFLSLIVFIPTIIFMPSSVVYRYRGIFYGLDAERRFMWSEAWNRFLQAPIFGVGYGKVGGLYGIGRSGPLDEFIASSIDHMPVIDSSYFFILNETGIVGFGLFCLLLIFIFKKGWSLMKELESPYLRQLSVCLFSILIALSAAAVTANIFGMVFPTNFYFWFLSGMLVNLKYIDSDFVQQKRKRNNRSLRNSLNNS